MTNQSKRDILEEILTRLAILQAKVDYLVSAKQAQDASKSWQESPNACKGVVEDGFKLTCNWPPDDHKWKLSSEHVGQGMPVFGAFPKDVEESIIPMHRGDDGKLVHDNADQDCGEFTGPFKLRGDVYFNGEEWVERPEDLSYIQKFYKEKEVE